MRTHNHWIGLFAVVAVTLGMSSNAIDCSVTPFNANWVAGSDYKNWVAAGGYKAVLPLADGKYFVAGTANGKRKNNDDFVIAKYNADGSWDRSFGNCGAVTHNYVFKGRGKWRRDNLKGAAMDSQGRIVAFGSNRQGAIVTRYNQDGSHDNRVPTDRT